MQALSPFHTFYGPQLSLFDPFSIYLWEHFLPTPYIFSNMEPLSKTQIEYKETPQAHQFKAEIPGVKKEDVKVEVEEGNVLHISAKKEHKKEDKNDKYQRFEHGIAEFSSRFKLPSNVKKEKIKSSVDNGVLTVTIPKQKVN